MLSAPVPDAARDHSLTPRWHRYERDATARRRASAARRDERHGAGDEAMRAKGFDDGTRRVRALADAQGGEGAADAAADAGATRYPGCPTPLRRGGMPEATAR